MKCETVAIIDLEGKYKVLYIGSDRGEARKIYKDMMTKKGEFQALFQQSGYLSRTISKEGHTARREKAAPKKKATPKKKKAE